MKTQMDGCSLRGWAVLLLLLVWVAPASLADVYRYHEAVLRLVDGLNQRSSEANLYGLLDRERDPDLDGDYNPFFPKHVGFTMQETVCSKKSGKSVEECDFKENGKRKYCSGTIGLEEPLDSLDDLVCEWN
ncbi:cathelicidin antimicrobial peptide-like [Tenrec ecaudatus]|uniref:cathelicidin antimicrobial peptide-like n=1 Tax=Tenrec ecaudatus TaxID=94439 RepID=UPI003F59A3FA